MFKKTCLEFLIVSIALVGFHALPVRYSSGPERVNVFGNYSSDKLVSYEKQELTQTIDSALLSSMFLTFAFPDYIYANLRLFARARDKR